MYEHIASNPIGEDAVVARPSNCETVNDTIIFLDSSMCSARSLRMRTSLRMKEGGAGIFARV